MHRREGAPASLLLLGGRADFLEKWAETIADLHEAGLAIASLDWRGQGLSTRAVASGAGHIDDFDTFLADLDSVAAALAADLPGLWLALAHSMGAHILLRWLADPGRRAHPLRARLRAAALTAPLCGLAMAAPLAAALRVLARRKVARGRGGCLAWGQEPFGRRQTSPARMAILTASPLRFAEERLWVAADPRLACGGVTWGWIDAFFRSETALAAALPGAIDIPLLALLAAEERLVSNAAARRALARVPGAAVETVAGARHEILREADPVRAGALSRILGFLAREGA